MLQLSSCCATANHRRQHPHLMHVMLATSAAHIRFLCAPSHRRSAFIPETYHKTQSAALLNQKLSQPIQPEDRDPLWATAATLSILSLCGGDDSSSEEVWPLKSSKSCGDDLEWLHLSKGKKVVWELVEPLRPGGMFSVLAKEYAEISRPPYGWYRRHSISPRTPLQARCIVYCGKQSIL